MPKSHLWFFLNHLCLFQFDQINLIKFKELTKCMILIKHLCLLYTFSSWSGVIFIHYCSFYCTYCQYKCLYWLNSVESEFVCVHMCVNTICLKVDVVQIVIFLQSVLKRFAAVCHYNSFFRVYVKKKTSSETLQSSGLT